MSAIIAVEGPDAGVPWHFGDPFREQRLLEAPGAAVDLSHRGVLTVSGPDRLGWLHSLTTQYLEGLAPGVGVTTLVLSPQGHIEHALYGVDDGETFWAHTEPGAAAVGRGLAGPDALHDAGRGGRSDRRLRDRLAFGPAGSARRQAQDVRSQRPGLPGRPRDLRPRAGPDRGAGRHAARGHLGVRGPADRDRGTADRRGLRPPHHPQRTRTAGSGGPPGEGLLPRSGDRGPGAHPGPTAASAGPAASRRQCRGPARRAAPLWNSTAGRWVSSAARLGTTSSARWRWAWSSATSIPTRC